MPYSEQIVQSVRPWSDNTFSFTLSRPQYFAFANGEFVTIGLKRDGKLVAREAFVTPERGADLFRSGGFSQRLGLPLPGPEHDRVMICGNPAMTREMTTCLKAAGWTLTNHRGVGNFSTELAFVIHHE